ncbi:MAG: hypothetical protein J5I94_08400 [Phaeodactylibacter sp.]|nr:hypothetical protein [Phaeodactylibacter sp.]
MRVGAAVQCLLIVLSFLPVWLLSADNAAEMEPDTSGAVTIPESHQQRPPEAAYPLNVPRP